MKINVEKTKVMQVSSEGGSEVNIVIDGSIVEQVNKFNTWGVMSQTMEDVGVEIKPRIVLAKNAFRKKTVE
jgi:hypothetical protein